MLEHLILLTALAVTTTTAYLLCRTYREHDRKSLRDAVIEVMECLGVFVVFMGLNASVAVLLILLTRAVTTTFVSLYSVGDLMLMAFSAFQGFVFRIWWRSS